MLADGHVYFTNEGAQRPSAEQALRSAFVAAANNASSLPAAVPLEESEQATGIFGMFRRLQRQLSSIEEDILKTVCLLGSSPPTSWCHPLGIALAQPHVGCCACF